MRVETIGNATLYLGDCREILPTLGKVDAVVTDPPYGVNGIGQRQGKTSSRANGKWDGLRHANALLTGDNIEFDPSFLLALNVPCVIWGANYFSDKLPKAGWLIWDKRLEEIAFYGSDAEIAWCSELRTVKIERHLWMGLCRASEIGEHYHPTQKPITIISRCIEICGKSQIILDPFMGSGTTGVACFKLGRQFVGIEIELKYFDIACRRIDEATRQPDMFIEKPVQEIQQSFPMEPGQ